MIHGPGLLRATTLLGDLRGRSARTAALAIILLGCGREADSNRTQAIGPEVEGSAPRVRPRDLVATFLEDGRVRVQSVSRGVGIEAPPPVVGILAYCSEPRTRRDVDRALGRAGLELFDRLCAAGMLVDPSEPQDEPFIRNFASIEVHRRMLADDARLEAYREALFRHVTPDSVVLDAGAGTGVLAVYAALAGARRVYAVEISDIADVIPLVARESGVEDRITVVRGDLSRVVLPEKADVLVTETFGAWALAEGAADDLRACIERNLKPGGRCIPSRVELWAAGLSEEPEDVAGPFRARGDGLRLEGLGRLARARSARVRLTADQLVAGTSQRVARLAITESRLQATLRLEAPCAALALWFVLELDEEAELSTAPDAPPTHWSQTVVGARLAEGDHTLVVRPAPEDRRTVQLRVGGMDYRIR